jgi:anti-sigma regulatory factor (Ser/Thr protein kinase)
MMALEKRGAEIRQFILEHVEKHPVDIVTFTMETFGISRQGVHRHIQLLRKQKALGVSGTTRKRRYRLRPLAKFAQLYFLNTKLEEDRIWRSDIRPVLGDLPANVLTIWQHGFTEIMNNAIEHSSGEQVFVTVEKTAIMTKMAITDDGQGIFKKIQREFGLHNEHDAVLELAKGKLTTDPAHHSGEGIFFTSRMFDSFSIHSGTVFFMHTDHEDEEPLLGDLVFDQDTPKHGTAVFMDLANTTSRTTQEVFNRFTSGEDYAFTKTTIPVRLARYGDEQLISRSQAKRLLARIDRFKVVVFEFTGVDTIGQAFADEVFRVFANAHPEIELYALGATPAVERMIRHVTEIKADAILQAEGDSMTASATLGMPQHVEGSQQRHN